jgi:hypothetical protein
LEETIIKKPTTHPGTNGPNENQIGDQRGVSTLICMDETYRILLSIPTTATSSQRAPRELPESSQRAPRELPESSHLQALVKYVS